MLDKKINKAQERPLYESQIKPYAFHPVYFIANAYLGLYHKIHYEDKGILQDFKDQGFFLISKHQKRKDIPLESFILYKKAGRKGNYIMKDSIHPLSKPILKRCGGIPIVRWKDLKKKYAHLSKEEQVRYAKQVRGEVSQIMLDLILQDEVVVFHPEAERKSEQEFFLNLPVLKRLFILQKDYHELTGKPVPFIPLNIIYDDRKKFRSEVFLRVGEPIQTMDYNLKDFSNEIKKRMDALT